MIFRIVYGQISSVLSQFTRLTDRRTDGRTDRIIIARPRLHSMQRGNNSYLVFLTGTPLADAWLSVCLDI